MTAKITSEQKTSIKTNKPNKAKEGKATEILPKKSDEAINNWKKLAVRKNFILTLFCGYS